MDHITSYLFQWNSWLIEVVTTKYKFMWVVKYKEFCMHSPAKLWWVWVAHHARSLLQNLLEQIWMCAWCSMIQIHGVVFALNVGHFTLGMMCLPCCCFFGYWPEKVLIAYSGMPSCSSVLCNCVNFTVAN